jgi:hypothetical protein
MREVWHQTHLAPLALRTTLGFPLCALLLIHLIRVCLKQFNFDRVIFWNVDKVMAWARKADGGSGRAAENCLPDVALLSLSSLCALQT